MDGVKPSETDPSPKNPLKRKADEEETTGQKLAKGDDPKLNPSTLEPVINDQNPSGPSGDDFDMDSPGVPLEEYEDDPLPAEPEKNKVTVLDTQALTKMMTSIIQKCTGPMELTPTTVRILLTHFKWDYTKLLEQFWGRGGQHEEFIQEVVDNSPDGTEEEESDSVKECQICFAEIEEDSSEVFGMNCGHIYCKPCWSNYLSTQITDGVGIANLSLTCAGHNCPIFLEDEVVTQLVTDPEVKVKYQQQILQTFVQSYPLMCICPSPTCKNALLVEKIDSSKAIKCPCGFTPCLYCPHSWHPTVKCDLLRGWKLKNENDSETSKWIIGFTKPCPKCSTSIEKNAGCNHMTCKNRDPVCKHEFCWLCMKPWKGHKDCNRFVEDQRVANDTAQTNRDMLKRYTFYYDRYVNHLNNLKLSEKVYGTVEELMTLMQKYLPVSWADVKYLRKAVETMMECRKTLTYTYVFLYYAKKSNQVKLFEDNQTDLEEATERMSDYLEYKANFSKETVEGIEKKLEEVYKEVKDLHKYCEDRRKKLVYLADEGYKNGWWVFNPEF